MNLELTHDERLALLDLIREDLSFFHESLRDGHKTVAAAMAEFDVTHTVVIYKKLDPEGYADLRKHYVEYIEEYLP